LFGWVTKQALYVVSMSLIENLLRLKAWQNIYGVLG